MMQWLIDIVYDAIVAALGHVWDIKDIVPDDEEIIIGDGSIWTGEQFDAVLARYPRSVDRGDSPTWDFLDADFTTDGTWHEISLAGIIPVGTKAVAIKLNILDDLVQALVSLKTRGNPNNINLSQAITTVANVWAVADLVVYPDANRLIQYWATNTPFTNIRLLVKGWWL